MKYTEIFFRTLKDNADHVYSVYEEEGREKNYTQNVINEIKLITDAKEADGKQATVVIGIVQHK